MQPTHQPNPQPKAGRKDTRSGLSTRRFVHPQSADEVDTLASERQARETQTQTCWAVKIFRGE